MIDALRRRGRVNFYTFMELKHAVDLRTCRRGLDDVRDWLVDIEAFTGRTYLLDQHIYNNKALGLCQLQPSRVTNRNTSVTPSCQAD